MADGSLTLRFDGPEFASDAADVTRWDGSCTPVEGGTAVEATSAAAPLVFPDLVNGTAYRCSVRTHTEIGDSEDSLELVGIPGATSVPQQPQGVWVEPLKGGIAVNLDVADTGDAPVTGYTARCLEASGVDAAARAYGVGTAAYRAALDSVPGRRMTGSSSPLIFGNVSTTTAYRCDVAAVNDLGSGPPSRFLLAAASPTKPGDVIVSPDLPAMPGGCGAIESATSETGAQIVVGICDPDPYNNGADQLSELHLYAAYRIPGGGFTGVQDLGSGLGYCRTCDGFYQRLPDIGRVVYRPVVYADGSGGVVFTRWVDDRRDLMEASFGPDGTFSPVRTLAAGFSMTAKWSLATSPNGDVALAWTGDGAVAYMIRRAQDNDFGSIELGPAGTRMPYDEDFYSGRSSITTDNIAFSASGELLCAYCGNAVRLNVDAGTSPTTCGLPDPPDVGLPVSVQAQFAFSDHEVTVLVVPFSLSASVLVAQVLSLDDGCVQTEKVLHSYDTGGFVVAAAAMNHSGAAMVAYNVRGEDGTWEMREARRLPGGAFGDSRLVGTVGINPSYDLQVEMLPDGYGVVGWHGIALDNTNYDAVVVVEPTAGPSSLRPMAGSVPGSVIHEVMRAPGSGVDVDRRGATALTESAGSTKARRVNSLSAKYRRAPSAPRSVRVTTWNHTARLTWAAPLSPGDAPVKAYAVQYSTNGRTWRTATAATSSTGYTVTGLKNSIRYRFRVLASNGATISKWATAIGKPSAVSSAPGTPAAMLAGQSATITWDAPQFAPELVTGYRLEVSVNGGRWKSLARHIAAADRTYVANGLEVGSSYRVRVVPLCGRRVGLTSPTSGAVLVF